MPRTTALRKAQVPPDPGRPVGVVRTQKVIPTMVPSQAAPREAPASQPSLCCGRCGHCEVHPCQLHTSV